MEVVWVGIDGSELAVDLDIVPVHVLRSVYDGARESPCWALSVPFVRIKDHSEGYLQ